MSDRHILLPPGLHRRAFALGLCAAALASASANAACPPVRVLFVCPAGSVKSAIARESLKRRAAEQGARMSVASRGVHPEDHVTAALSARLKADGIDPAAEPLRALTPEDVAQADLVIAFDEAAAAPMLLGRARAWKTPSWNSDYAAAKADLDARLSDLLAEIATQAAPRCPPA